MKTTKSELLLSCIGDINPEFIENAERKVNPKAQNVKRINYRMLRLVPVAACLTLVIALTAIIGNNANWFSPVYTSELDNGATLSYHKSGVVGSDSQFIPFDVTSRDLSNEENKALFGDLPDITLYAAFNTNDNSLVHAEGTINGAKIILAAPDVPLTDTIIETDKNVSEINGISVHAGYFITKANSHGIKNIIYVASFRLGDTSVYIEHGGDEAESEKLRNEISDIINQLTKLGTIDLSKVTY